MSVYVDAAAHGFRRRLMCHMLADTPAELHAMAEKIGIKRRWYQRAASTPHYDVCKTKRALAVAAGAVEITQRELVGVIRSIRQHIMTDSLIGKQWIEDYKRELK